jgi:hypothetical protein
MSIDFTEVRKQNRTYHFADGSFRIDNVVRFAIPGRSHRIETDDGRKFIVRCGWHANEIEVDEWTA